MIILYFFYGLAFEGLGLATYLQLRREGDFPLKRELPWLAAFGFVGGAAGWVDMFLASGSLEEIVNILSILRVLLHMLTGGLLLRFGWGMLNNLNPLPAWAFSFRDFDRPDCVCDHLRDYHFITPSPINPDRNLDPLLLPPGIYSLGRGSCVNGTRSENLAV